MKQKYIAKRYWSDIPVLMGENVDKAKEYKDLINLCLGDPDLTTDERIIKAAFEDVLKGHTHYTDVLGYPELREEICKYYQEEYNYNVNISECMVTTSACHAMWLVLETILDDGDEVIIPGPYFAPYPQQIKLTRGTPVVLETYEEDGFQINLDKLKATITDKTKALIINTPNNPTGACYSKEMLEGIALVAKEYDLLIIADDIYTIFTYEQPFIPITTLKDMKDRTITICSFSKDYCMTGWRIGYVLAPQNIINTMKDINENSVFTAPAPSQRAAIHGLKMRKDVQPSIVEEYKKRVYYAYERINKINNMSVLSPKGSIYLFVNIKDTGLTSAQVADEILSQAHVLVIPGNAFGDCGEGYLRLALTVGMDKLKEVFDRLEKMRIFIKS